MPVMTDGVYGPASQEEKDAMHEALKRLDPKGEGITPNILRVAYPKTAWGEIHVTLRELAADGRARNFKRSLPGSPTQFEHWVWL